MPFVKVVGLGETYTIAGPNRPGEDMLSAICSSLVPVDHIPSGADQRKCSPERGSTAAPGKQAIIRMYASSAPITSSSVQTLVERSAWSSGSGTRTCGRSARHSGDL